MTDLMMHPTTAPVLPEALSFKRAFQTLLDQIDEGAYVVDPRRRILAWNRSAEKITGYAAADVIGSRCADGILNHVDASGRVLCTSSCPLHDSMVQGCEHAATVYLRHKQGHRVPVKVRTSPLFGVDDELVGGLEVFQVDSDQTADMGRLREMARLAFIDPLTGLGNRRYLEQVLAAQLVSMKGGNQPFAVVFIDIDQFRGVVDAYGLRISDLVLTTVGRTLKAVAGPGSVVGRWGADEFVVVLAAEYACQAETIAQRIVAQIAASDVGVPGGKATVTVSAGLITCRPDEIPAALVERASLACRQSRDRGGHTLTIDS